MLKNIGKFILVLLQTFIILGMIILICVVAYFFLYRGETIEIQQGLATIEKINPIQDEVKTTKEQIDNTLSGIEQSTTLQTTTNPTQTNINGIIDSKNYYASQLDENAKIIYNKLYENKENLKTGTFEIKMPTQINNLLYEPEGELVLGTAFQNAWDAFIYDNPEMFFIDTTKVCLTTQTTTIGLKKTYEVSIGKGDNANYLNDNFQTQEHINNVLKQIENVKQQIVSNCYGTDANKVKQIHDWLIQNLEYDTSISRTNAYNIYGALVERVVVCEGYAKAFKVLMDELEIPCILVKGTGTNSNGQTEKHMWNYVFLNEKWYAIDVTWDDPIIEGNGYVSNSVYYRYYLKGAEEFFKTHKEEGQISYGGKIFEYPSISQEEY